MTTNQLDLPLPLPGPKPNPWSITSILSRITFVWVLPLIRMGRKKVLEPADLWPAPEIYESSNLTNQFSLEWEKELKTSETKHRKPKLYRAIGRFVQQNLTIYYIVLGFDELVIRVAQPLCLRLLIGSFEENSKTTRRDQIIYAALVCVCTFIHNFVQESCVFLMLRTGLMCRVGLTSYVYKKMLKLSPFARKEATTGKMMTLISNDVGRFDFGFIHSAYAFLAPIQTTILVYFLWKEVGVSTLGGITLAILIMPLQVYNGRKTAKYRDNIAKQTDERSRIMDEIIMAIRVIKMYTWEKPFCELVNKIRRSEVGAIGKKMYMKGFYLSLYSASNKLAPFLSILIYVLLGNPITAERAFFVVAVFQTIIENMVYFFSITVAFVGELWISVRRMEEFLVGDEQIMIQSPEVQTHSETIETHIKLSHAYARWNIQDKFALNNFSTEIAGGKLVMVIGGVGCGKSSFLHSLLAELPLSSGDIKVHGSITYASQEPWLFSGTVRENILFGMAHDRQLYYNVASASALIDDFKQLPNGDLTIVGERGMSLSGGQKARINLARALYRNTDIVLLDDPLSAVDPKVSKHIFEKCIRRYLRGKLRILATHQIQYIPLADYVIVMKNGEIIAQGTPVEIQRLGLDLVRLTEEDESQDGKSSIAKPPEACIIPEATMPEDVTESSMEKPVTVKTYWKYLRANKSFFGFLNVIFLFLFGQITLTAADFWLSLWTNSAEIHRHRNGTTVHFDRHKPLEILDQNYFYGDQIYLIVYSGFIISIAVSALTRAAATFRYFLQISVKLHDCMFISLVRAPTKFFDENPSGRIMNRFTKDIGSVDELLPPTLYNSTEYILQFFGVIIVVVYSNYYLAIPSSIIIIILYSIRSLYLHTSRVLKKIESQAKSPVLSHLAATIHGLTTVRALKSQEHTQRVFDRLQDIHTAPWFLFLGATRWFTLWVGTLSAIFLTVITVTFLIFNDISGGIIGFVITSTITLTTNLQWALRESADAENYMTCVARCLEYSDLKSEAEWESKPDKKPPAEWPTAGHIQFNDVCLAYADTDVLKNLCLEIKPQEKIGIVGRTGAGKSTIISALFRLTEPRGDIIIDGVKVNDIGLHDLRKNISIIPQDPVLFSGTIRYNLDPLNQFLDADIWKVLEEIQLTSVGGLEAMVEDGGINFSIGQRQLICLARAILKNNHIIVMDEATANVDPRTDMFIQNTIRDKFQDCSIITIAHRLQTVMDCDKVLVLEKGSMKEFAHPHLLLQNKNGYLYNLVSFSGANAASLLREMARKHYIRKTGFNELGEVEAPGRSYSSISSYVSDSDQTSIDSFSSEYTRRSRSSTSSYQTSSEI